MTAAGALLLSAGWLTPAAAGGVYFVKDGDTLYSISRVFKTTPEAIRELNALSGTRIAPGDRLRMPAATEEPWFSATLPPPPAMKSEDLPRHAVDPERVRQALCREETVYHTVVKGDTLSAVSRRYDVPLESLLGLNRIRSRSRLSIGQKLIVRRTGPRSHVVRRGDTYRKIAARYGVEVAELQRLNGTDDTALAIGQRLVLEPCDRLAAAGSAPPPFGAAGESGEFLTAVAQTSAEAAREARAVLASLPPGSVEAAAAPSVAQQVIDLAKTMLNIPYRFGGTTLRGIDCSAYVQRVFGLIDLDLPRTAREQFGVGARVDREDLSVGDLVFFRTYASFPSHVGIYLGDNRFIHASSVGRKVTIDSLDQRFYRKRFIGARRLLENAVPAVASAP